MPPRAEPLPGIDDERRTVMVAAPVAPLLEKSNVGGSHALDERGDEGVFRAEVVQDCSRTRIDGEAERAQRQIGEAVLERVAVDAIEEPFARVAYGRSGRHAAAFATGAGTTVSPRGGRTARVAGTTRP